MERWWNVWGPWYLMLEDKLGKDVNIATISFHTTKIESYSIWTIDMLAMGELKLQCVQGPHPWVKTLFAQCGKLVPPPLKT
jgi:hypothetical protein